MKAVIFDLDGIITDTAKYHYIAWKNMAARIGIVIDEEFNERLKGISRMGSLELILEYGGKQDAYNAEQKQAMATEKNTEYLELLRELGPQDLLPGIEKLLEELRTRGYAIALASASKNSPAILTALGVADYFPVVADPAAVAQGKPAPDIFLAAAQGLGVKPQHCVGVEDAAAGVQAIKAAGMKAVAAGRDNALRQSGADVYVDSTAEVTIELIERLLV